MSLPILCFKPSLKSVVWGGRKLVSLLHKSAESDALLGESWEVGDLPDFQSVVHAPKPLAGKSLHELIREHGDRLIPSQSLMGGRFPLLFKFIDAKTMLSVQVHPNEEAAARIGEGARSKNEAWYIVDCEPGSFIYAGLMDGVTRPAFEAAVEDNAVERLLRKIVVKPGEFYNLPAGEVHAIGGGILLAEVQQSSDTTYRVYDYNRVDGATGKLRELHVEQAVESINFGPPPSLTPSASGLPGISTPYFDMYLLTLQPGANESIEAEGPVALMGVGGERAAEIEAHGCKEMLRLGDTLLIPACISGDIRIRADAEIRLLVTTIP